MSRIINQLLLAANTDTEIAGAATPNILELDGVLLTNQSGTACNIRLAYVPENETLSAKHYFVFAAINSLSTYSLVAENSSLVIELGGKLYARSDNSNTSVTITSFK